MSLYLNKISSKCNSKRSFFVLLKIWFKSRNMMLLVNVFEFNVSSSVYVNVNFISLNNNS